MAIASEPAKAKHRHSLPLTPGPQMTYLNQAIPPCYVPVASGGVQPQPEQTGSLTPKHWKVTHSTFILSVFSLMLLTLIKPILSSAHWSSTCEYQSTIHVIYFQHLSP